MSDSLFTALALLLVLEGVLPFLVPGVWRDAFRKLTELTDGQLRFMGLTSMVVGMLMLFLARGA